MYRNDPELRRLIRKDLKVGAIAHLVKNHGMTPPEAKEYVGRITYEVLALPPEPEKFGGLLKGDNADIVAALHGGGKLAAVKIARERLGLSLSEGKEFVEQLAKDNPRSAREDFEPTSGGAKQKSSAVGGFFRKLFG